MDGAEAGKAGDPGGGGTLLELIPAVGTAIEIENESTSEVLGEIQHGAGELPHPPRQVNTRTRRSRSPYRS